MRDADGDKIIPMKYILPFVALFVGGAIWLKSNRTPAEEANKPTPIAQLDNSKTQLSSQSQTSDSSSVKKSVVGLWVDNSGTQVVVFNANGSFSFASLSVDSFGVDGTWLEQSDRTLKLTGLNGKIQILPFSFIGDWLVLVMPDGEKPTLHKITPTEFVVIDARIKQLMKR